MGLPNYATKIDERNPLFPDIWSRSSYTNGGKFVQHKDFGFFSSHKWWVNDEAAKFSGRAPRNGNNLVGKLPTEASSKVWWRGEVERILC